MMKSRFKQLKLNALIWALIIPVINSTIKYLADIDLLQFLHLPFKKINDIKGKLSYQIIFFLHLVQKERPLIICLLFGKR